MRFGKKLALMIDQDLRHGREVRPYISHKRLKQILSDMVRLQKDVGNKSTDYSVFGQFRSHLECDFEQIKGYLSLQLHSLNSALDDTITESKNFGITDKRSLESLIAVYKQILADSCPRLHDLLNESIMSLWISSSASVAAICDKFLVHVETFRIISAYVEINVAGFRKIIKQFHKQLPDAPDTRFEPNYADLALELLRTQNRIESFRKNLDVISQALSATMAPLPLAELGSETITALLNQREPQKQQDPHLTTDLMKDSMVVFPQIHP